MIYAIVKIIHIISASILFGVGLCTAFYMLMATISHNSEVVALATKRVVIADAWFTGISGVLQLVTGFWLLHLQVHSFDPLWLLWVMLLYGLAGACWLIVVYLQIQCRDLACHALKNDAPLPPLYYRYFIMWVLLGIPAFVALIALFYLMANNPFVVY